jgi:hypothetical protein
MDAGSSVRKIVVLVLVLELIFVCAPVMAAEARVRVEVWIVLGEKEENSGL